VADKLTLPPAVFFAVRFVTDVTDHTLFAIITNRNAQSRETHYTFVADVAGSATIAGHSGNWF
jgi:hypothetical protein